jgi:hypothetical protein
MTAVIICLVLLIGFISWLSFKERRELNNRLMANSVDEFIKMSDTEKKPDVTHISQHRKLVNSFKAKGVNNV